MKGFIEVTTITNIKILVNVSSIDTIEDAAVVPIKYSILVINRTNKLEVTETYEEVKQLIINAQ